MRYILILLSFILYVNGYCDKIQVPFSLYPKELVRKFEICGYKLDLDGNDRTRDSWGFLENRGTEFFIYTYKPVTKEELKLIQRIQFLGEENGKDYCICSGSED